MGPRLAFPLFTVVAFAAIVTAACGDDDASPGDASDGGLIDSYIVDTSTDPRIPPAVFPRLTFVNAAHDLGAQASVGRVNATVRLCFATGPSTSSMEVLPLAPAPDFVMENSATALPGVDQGRGVTLPDLPLPTTTRPLYPIVVSSRAIASSGVSAPTCDRLVGPRSEVSFELSEGVDYWVLPAIALFTLQPQHAYILALTGCADRAITPNPGKCGPGFVLGEANGLGNLALRVFEPLALPGAQLLHVSSATNAFFSQSNERSLVQPGLDIAQAGLNDAGTSPTFVPIAAADPPLFTLSPVTTTSFADKAVVELGPQRFSLGRLESFFTDVALASGRNNLPFMPSGSYVFVAIGDPDPDETPRETQIPEDGGGTTTASNSRAFHFLGFPSMP